MKVIPAIDLKDGRCVRLYQGEFDRETHYSDDPLAVATRFESMGFRGLHVVDLDGARSGTQHHQDVVRSMAGNTGLEVQLGGGIRSRDTVTAWLGAGVVRCVIGSIAITDPGSVAAWIESFGADRIVLALDVRIDADGTPRLTSHGWTRTSATSLWEYVDDMRERGLCHVLCTDVGRDGAMAGPNVDLYSAFCQRYPDIRLQASGGVRHIGDLETLRAIGADSAITGKALLDGKITREEIVAFLRNA
ncbi:MAG: 1-(5-phosphoribosyl)-5-[(5-phosphoribosylamino)methylideneamino]imidazole-4-carboxamide isomerase [Gammaproteobacteria bacterium]|nr:1-(5-phosphoribosyl)-5-[(5-phosphoribosylamino)methylideneamino]imidazole-4-carboxamide isomerase [Gammaproteobacteria bacterium]